MERTDLIESFLRQENFALYAQPIISAQESATPSCYHEVLLRLKNQDELVYPNEFFPVAERLRMEVAIDRWVIRNSLRALQRANPKEKISLNITKATLQTGNRFSAWLIEEVKDLGLAEERIEIEIDESDCLQCMDESQEIFSALAGFGCHMSIDDYLDRDGLAKRLQSMPFSVIKIDGSLVQEMTRSTEAMRAVENIVAVAHNGEKKTIAEFVTNQQVAETLQKAGVDFLQGSWAGPTVPLDQALGITTFSSNQ